MENMPTAAWTHSDSDVIGDVGVERKHDGAFAVDSSATIPGLVARDRYRACGRYRRLVAARRAGRICGERSSA